MNTDHEKYMREALKEARRAEAEGEIPIGAVVVCEGRIMPGRTTRPKPSTTPRPTPRCWP